MKAKHPAPLHTERAEKWSFQLLLLRAIEIMLKKRRVGGGTSHALTRDLVTEALPPIDYAGRVTPAKAHCIVQCCSISDADKGMMSNCLKCLSLKLFTWTLCVFWFLSNCLRKV